MYSQIRIVELVCNSHLIAGRNQVCKNHIDMRHNSYQNGKCNKCDRNFICVDCNFTFFLINVMKKKFVIVFHQKHSDVINVLKEFIIAVQMNQI